VQTRAGGHRLEAAYRAVQIGAMQELDKGEEPEIAGLSADHRRHVLKGVLAAKPRRRGARRHVASCRVELFVRIGNH
jgi:hypothetical protein